MSNYFIARCKERDEEDGRNDLYKDKSSGAGRFVFSMHLAHASTPGSFQESREPYEKPLLLARYRLIYSRKVAIVDIKRATPTLYRKRVACVLALRYADREWCRLTYIIFHLTLAIALCTRNSLLTLNNSLRVSLLNHS